MKNKIIEIFNLIEINFVHKNLILTDKIINNFYRKILQTLNWP
jgi:hypothetical protein